MLTNAVVVNARVLHTIFSKLMSIVELSKRRFYLPIIVLLFKNILTLTGSKSFKQRSAASKVSFCEICVKFSTTRISIRFMSRGRHKRFASSNKFKHLSAETGGISSLYKNLSNLSKEYPVTPGRQT